LAAVALDNIAMASGHGEVGEGSDEANDASNDTGKGNNLCDLCRSLISLQIEYFKSSAEEEERWQEQQGERHPKDSVRLQIQVSSVNSASGAAAVQSGSFAVRLNGSGFSVL
jgi:hypothetical protein